MSDSYHEVGSKGQTFINGMFNAILKDKGQIHPDQPGAKKPTPFLRYSFLVPDPEAGEGETKTIPEKVMMIPYWRAYEMAQNRDGKFISEEEALPYLERQNSLEKEAARIADIEAEEVIAQRKAEMGDIPDVIDNDARFEKIENQIKDTDDKLNQILSLLTKGQS